MSFVVIGLSSVEEDSGHSDSSERASGDKQSGGRQVANNNPYTDTTISIPELNSDAEKRQPCDY